MQMSGLSQTRPLIVPGQHATTTSHSGRVSTGVASPPQASCAGMALSMKSRTSSQIASAGAGASPSMTAVMIGTVAVVRATRSCRSGRLSRHIPRRQSLQLKEQKVKSDEKKKNLDVGKWLMNVDAKTTQVKKDDHDQTEDLAKLNATEDNVAFMFIKPRCDSPDVRDLIRQRLEEHKMEIVREGELTAQELKERRVVEHHFSSLSEKALAMPDSLVVHERAQEAFQDAFGVSWRDAIDDGLVLNVPGALEKFGCSAMELEEEWERLELNKDKLKFGGGFYCGCIRDHYVINGFYVGLQNMYIQPNTKVRYMLVRWRPEDMKWKDFREQLIGEVDPAKAVPGSLRHEIYMKWKKLGLESPPDTACNVIHGSASPMEALWERFNWLEQKTENDPLAKVLGLDDEKLEMWGREPVVKIEGSSEKKRLWDVFENKDIADCLNVFETMKYCVPEDDEPDTVQEDEARGTAQEDMTDWLDVFWKMTSPTPASA